MNIKIIDKNGVTLKTKGKYCKEDISVAVDESILGGGLPIEVSSTEEMDALLVTENIGKIYKFIGTTDSTYTNGELYQVVEEA